MIFSITAMHLLLFTVSFTFMFQNAECWFKHIDSVSILTVSMRLVMQSEPNHDSCCSSLAKMIDLPRIFWHEQGIGGGVIQVAKHLCVHIVYFH